MLPFAPTFLRRVRQLSACFGIALAVAALASITSIYEGLQADFRKLLGPATTDRISATILFDDGDEVDQYIDAAQPEGLQLFQGTVNAYAGQAMLGDGPPPAFTQANIDAIRALPTVKDIGWESFEGGLNISADLNPVISRATSSFFTINNLPLAQGRLPTPEDGPNAVVIGNRLAQRLFGELSPIGEVLEADPQATVDTIPLDTASKQETSPTPQRFYVVGVLAPVSQRRPDAWIGYDTYIYRIDAQPNENLRNLFILPQPGQQAAALADVKRLLEPVAKPGNPIGVVADNEYYQTSVLGAFQQLVTRSLAWVLALGAVLLAVTIGSTALLAVILRAPQTGIQRSLGAPRTTIMRAFAWESVLVGLAGALGGLGLAWLARPLAAAGGDTTPVFGPLTFGTMVVLTVLIGLLATLVPALRLVRHPPAHIMRERSGVQLRRRWLWGAPGLLLSVLALVVVLAIRDGLAARMDDILNWTGQRSITFGNAGPYDFLIKPAFITKDDYQAVHAAFPTYTVGWMGDSMFMEVEASANLPQLRPIQLRCGRWFTADEEAQGAAVLVLAHKRAQQLATRTGGDPCALLDTQWNGKTIVGILGEWPLQYAQGYTPYSAYGPLSARLSAGALGGGAFGSAQQAGKLIVDIPPGEDIGAAAERVKAFLAARHPEGEPQMLLPAGVTQALLTQRTQILTLAGVMAVLCLAIGTLGLMNWTFIAVLSRAREVGVRRALGATRQQIVVQVLSDTVRLCLGAGLLGAAGGLAIAYVLQQRWQWPQVWHGELVGVALVVAVVTGLVAGALPAWWAATLPPTRAIKTE